LRRSAGVEDGVAGASTPESDAFGYIPSRVGAVKLRETLAAGALTRSLYGAPKVIKSSVGRRTFDGENPVQSVDSVLAIERLLSTEKPGKCGQYVDFGHFPGFAFRGRILKETLMSP
jgi:hypothetical protein